jgi:hypothetical protein
MSRDIIPVLWYSLLPFCQINYKSSLPPRQTKFIAQRYRIFAICFLIYFTNLRNPMKQSRVKRLAFFFFSFFYSTLYALLAQSCMLAGPAAEREWAIKKLVAVWPPQPDSTQRSITAGFNSGRLPILLFVLADFRRHIKLHTAESSYSQRRGT